MRYHPTRRDEENAMTKRLYLLALISALLFAGAAGAQGLIMDMVANKVIQKYQQSTCEQLWQQKGQPKSAQEQEMVQLLRGDPQARTAFIDKVAGPIVNKMFDCGMIP